MKQYRKYLGITLCALAALLFAQAALAGDLNGTWDIVFDTEGGERESQIELKIDGETATGAMGDTILKGTFKDGKLDLAGDLYVDEAGYQGEMKISGKLDGDKLIGDASWDMYEMTFVATKE